MTVQKISTLAELAAINAGDYILVSEDAGAGSYNSKKYDLSGLVAKADKDADAVVGNFAEFDASGNPVDSSESPSSFDPAGAAATVQLNLDRHIGTTDVLPTLDLQFHPDGGDERFFGFVRPSIGTRVNPKGQIETKGSGEVRYDYDPVTGEYLRVLIEPSRTNLLSSSDAFSSTDWTRIQMSVSSGAITAPDGNSAEKLIADVSSDTVHYVAMSRSFVSGTQYCFSAWVKKGDYQYINLQLRAEAFPSYYTISLDFDTGVVTAFSSPDDFGVKDYGNGWYRIWLVGTANTTINVSATWIRLADIQEQHASFVGDGASGTYVWRAQLEIGPYPTSGIPTPVGATVTREADLMSITGTDFTDFYNQTEGTIVVEASGGESAARLFSFDNGDANNQIQLTTTPDNLAWYIKDSTTVQAAITIGSASGVSWENMKAAVAYKANDFSGSLNGATVVTDSSGTVPTMTQLGIGYQKSSEAAFLSGHIKRLTYYPRRLSDSTLVTLSS